MSRHRSYQPTLPCGNKLLQQRWDQTYYDEHRRMVRAARPMVDTGAPKKHPHVTAKWKKQQVEKERAEEIERENCTLLKKMQRIMQTQGSVDHRNTRRRHSLNQQQREEEVKRVMAENKEILKRLQRVEPIYKVSDWIDDWQRKEEHVDRITAYPGGRIPTATRKRSASLPPISRAVSAPHKTRPSKTAAPAKQPKRGVASSGPRPPPREEISEPGTKQAEGIPPSEGEGGTGAPPTGTTEPQGAQEVGGDKMERREGEEGGGEGTCGEKGDLQQATKEKDDQSQPKQ